MNTTVTCNLGFFKERTTATLKEPQCFFTNTGLCSGRFQPVRLLSLRLVCISRLGLLIQTSTWVLSCLFLWGEERQAVWRGGTNAKHLDPPNPAKLGRPSANYEYTTERKTYYTSQELNRICLSFQLLLKVCWLYPTNFLIQLFYSPWSINMTRAGKVNQKLHRLFMTYMQNK